MEKTTRRTQAFTPCGRSKSIAHRLVRGAQLQGDLGYTQVKPKDQDALGMFEATFAPTLTPAPGSEGGFFVRPEIRVFVTYASWNDAAATAGVASGLLGDKTSGFSYGTSVETWF